MHDVLAEKVAVNLLPYTRYSSVKNHHGGSMVDVAISTAVEGPLFCVCDGFLYYHIQV